MPTRHARLFEALRSPISQAQQEQITRQRLAINLRVAKLARRAEFEIREAHSQIKRVDELLARLAASRLRR
jgi:hypothetical protein